MKEEYSQAELDKILSTISSRVGWDFSSMNTVRDPVPWDYLSEVQKRITRDMDVLDIGTGGGERFISLADSIKEGLGIDIDPEMIDVATKKTKDTSNISFKVADANLGNISKKFDVILNRHAPYILSSVAKHLKSNGIFITQQVGEENMLNIKKVLDQESATPTITKTGFESSELEVIEFQEYNVKYVVQDIESLVFWLKALNMLHADIATNTAIQQSGVLNKILKGNVDEKGFTTNEHRYFVIAKLV